jgi:hypothetical protein
MIAARSDDGTLDITADFDPRITRRGWLTASAGESPGATLTRFEATIGELLTRARDLLARNPGSTSACRTGRWTGRSRCCTGLWDSWIHEREVLLARSTEHPAGDDATFYAGCSSPPR